jgi:hypothetical protein
MPALDGARLLFLDFTTVAAGILPAVKAGVSPPGNRFVLIKLGFFG